jgi:hypothetical protein
MQLRSQPRVLTLLWQMDSSLARMHRVQLQQSQQSQLLLLLQLMQCQQLHLHLLLL